jgi:class 3 adenylate cyclase
MIVCPQCGTENRGEARFCDSCGAGLAREEASSREERKVVTVLFADLVGFTSKAERMDPEDVRAVLEPYHAHLRSELERYGGTVEKFIGDAVMALFGAPVAHEDDPERAIRAALAIRDWVQEQQGLQLRIAVTTGEALIALGARPSEGEGMASGDVVNTAARLQSAAPVNGILVDETTYRATAQAISYGDQDAVEAKGKAEPIKVWEALEARARLGVDLVRGAGGPLVGREKELDLLRDALNRARQEEAAQLVTLVGVPGIGKTRLVAELFGDIERDPELVYWRQGRCLPYGEGVTYWALSEMVKAQAGILESDSEQEVEEQLRASVAEALSSAADAAWVEGHLRPLVGLAETIPASGDRRAEAYAAWRRFFEGLAEQRPLVLVFDDLHWADESLLDFVDHLVDWATSVPLLVVCTARPELLSRRPGWGGGKPNAATISLSPLSDDDTARLVHGLLERALLPAEVQSTLIERAGGNPLYAEEFARMVDELDSADEGEIRLPESVQGIIAARLDALPLEEKQLLQDAAIVGKVFWLGSLALIGNRDRLEAEQLLHSLERKEFVRRERRSSVGDDSQYAFRHILVRDVAYSQIPRAARAEKHERAAAWIESLGRPDDQAEMLAHHFLSALEFARATGEEPRDITDRARTALRAAGDRALALSSFDSAARFYDAALDLSPADDPERAYLLLGYGKARYELEVEGDDALLEASAELEDRDREAAAEAEITLADLFWRRGQHAESARHRERAAKLIADAEVSRMKTHVFGQLARFHMLAGEFEPAVRFGESALAMAESLGLDEERARALNTIGAARVESDHEGIALIERSIEVSRNLHSIELVRGLNNLAHQLAHRGRVSAADAAVTEMDAVARRFGYRDWIRWAEAKRATLSYFLGDWARTYALVDALIGEIEQGGSHYLEGEWRMYRSRIRLARGERKAAVEDARRGLEAARAAGDPQMVAPLLSWNARMFGAEAEGVASFEEFIALWLRTRSVQGAPTFAPDAAVAARNLGRGKEFVAAAQSVPGGPWVDGAVALASDELARAAAIFGEVGALPDEADARFALSTELVDLGRRAEAEPELRKALEFWRSVGATEYVREGESLLAASA